MVDAWTNFSKIGNPGMGWTTSVLNSDQQYWNISYPTTAIIIFQIIFLIIINLLFLVLKNFIFYKPKILKFSFTMKMKTVQLEE